MNLDIESLRTFLAVLEHGSMTGAARSLHLSQSAVSWKMKRLEAKVGQPLLLRDGRTIRPSHAGRSILDDARRIVEAHDSVVARLRSAELSGSVRVGAVEDVGVYGLTTILGSFRRVHPSADLNFVIAPSRELDARLRNGQLDIALLQVLDEDLRPGDLVVRDEPITWVTSADWANVDEPVSLVAYSDTCFYRGLAVRQLMAAGIDHRVRFTIPHIDGVRSAVAAGLGVTVLGRHELNESIVEWPRAAQLPAFPEVRHILRRATSESSPIVDALVEVMTWELEGATDNAEPVVELADGYHADPA